jgi:hypothetical protein
MTWRCWASLSCIALATTLAPKPAAAQLAPLGGHYAGRPSDTGFMGEVNSSGGYQASVPLDLPAARGGLPIPLQIRYGERGVGAAGAGWDVPLSYIRRDTTIARRRPVGTPEVDPQAREQVSLVLDGRRLTLVRTASGWAAQRDAPDLVIREQGNGTWVVFDGQGRTYLFTVAAPALAGLGLWHLASVTGAGGNKVALTYNVGNLSVSGAADAVTMDLGSIQYNPDLAGCYKNTVTLGYSPTDPPISLLSMSPVGSKLFIRVSRLLTIDVASKPTCAASPQTLRSYQLTYQQDPDTALPRLTKVQMTGRQGTPEGTTPVVIGSYTYGTASNAGQLTYQAAPSIPAMSSGFLSSLGSTGGDIPARPSESFGFSTAPVFTDVTGDGRPDLASFFGLLPNLPTGIGGSPTLAASIPFAMKPLEKRTTQRTRYDQSRGVISNDKLWRQMIDVDGDGRVDIVDAAEEEGVWAVYLNTPDPMNPQNAVWARQGYSTAALAQQLRARGMWDGDNYIPLALRSTVHDLVYSTCASWNGHLWFEDTDESPGGRCPPGGHFESRGPESTITQWELKDVNGDGYPDVVLSSQGLFVHEQLGDLPRPIHPPPRQVPTTRTDSVRPAADNQILAMFNVAGVHLVVTSSSLFSAPVVLRNNAACVTVRPNLAELPARA